MPPADVVGLGVGSAVEPRGLVFGRLVQAIEVAQQRAELVRQAPGEPHVLRLTAHLDHDARGRRVGPEVALGDREVDLRLGDLDLRLDQGLCAPAIHAPEELEHGLGGIVVVGAAGHDPGIAAVIHHEVHVQAVERGGGVRELGPTRQVLVVPEAEVEQ